MDLTITVTDDKGRMALTVFPSGIIERFDIGASVAQCEEAMTVALRQVQELGLHQG
ncbi:MAG TPA: hypothetical protein VI756_32600 [Blastocatellia bacterium]